MQQLSCIWKFLFFFVFPALLEWSEIFDSRSEFSFSFFLFFNVIKCEVMDFDLKYEDFLETRF